VGGGAQVDRLVVHNAPKRTPPHKQRTTTKHYTATNWERSQKKSPVNCAVVANDVPRRKTRLAASQSNIVNSPNMGPSSSSHTHTVGDPPDLVKLQHKTLLVTPMKTTDPDHFACGPRLFHRLTLLCQGLRYLKPMREQHLRLAVAEDTTTMRTNSSPPCPRSVVNLPGGLVGL
jgi:hypothetical protein